MNFLESLKKDINSFISKGYITNARNLNSKVATSFREKCPPIYYTGNLDSNHVFIQQNPYYAESIDCPTGKIVGQNLSSVEDYHRIAQNFGKYKLEEKGTLSGFDKKQIEFVRGLGILDDRSFKSDKEEYGYIRKSKLQIEAVPYGSSSFSMKIINTNQKVFKDYFDRFFELINSIDRKAIIFLGSFQKFLDKVYKPKSFCKYELKDAKKANGEPMKYSPKLYRLDIEFDSKLKKVWVASTYASQSLHSNLVRQYGEFCRKIIFDNSPH